MHKTSTYLISRVVIYLMLFSSCLAIVGSHFFYLLYVILAVLFILVSFNAKFKANSYIDIIPLVIIVLWVYGVMLGIFKGNQVSYVLQNFAGMIFYSFYYMLLIAKASVVKLVRAVLFFSLLAVIFNFFILNLFGLYFLGLSCGDTLLGFKVTPGFMLLPRYYYSGEIAFFPVYAVSLHLLLVSDSTLKVLSKKYFGCFIPKKWIVLTLFMSLGSGIMILSKGFLLAYFVVTNMILLNVLFYPGFHKRKLVRFRVALIISVTMLLSFSLISSVFSTQDQGNHVRVQQLSIITDDLYILGKGLGAVIPSYQRDADQPYGMELSYLSLFHKFGLFATIYFLSIGILVILWFKKKGGIEVPLVFGLMAYTIPAIGNPILFYNLSVFFHVLTLYILRSSSKKVNSYGYQLSESPYGKS